MEFLLYFLIAVVSTIVVYRGSGMLEKYSEEISHYYRLPPIIHGSIVVAVGSSFPELSSTVISTWIHGEFELGVSAIVGSAIFNILAIPALSVLFAKEPLRADKELVFKDAQFYLISVSVTLITFSFATIYYPDPSLNSGGSYTRGLVLVPLGTYLVYLFLQYLEVREYKNPFPEKKGNPWRMWAMLILSLVLIVGGVEGLVQFCLYLGELLDTRSFIWGLSIMAIVTSLPDMVISIRLARAGQSVVSLSNVLGSNIFDLLVALPAGILVAGSALIDFEIAVPMMAALTAATLLLFVFMRYELDINRREAWVLLVFYVGFLAWAFTL
jgi:cation:H+ antiporter